jgi:hypothetical protein
LCSCQRWLILVSLGRKRNNQMLSIVHISHVLFFGLAAGIWIGVIVSGKAPRTSLNPVVFIEWIQGARSIMKWFMPSLLVVTLMSGLASWWYARGHGLGAWLIGLDLVCLLLAIVITRLVEVPIVNGIAKWSSAQPPADWLKHRDRWMCFHAIRATAMLVGFASGLISLVVSSHT